jgi:hypothetical protein
MRLSRPSSSRSNEGFNDVRLLKSDEDLASLRGEDQFAALVKRVGEKG